MSSTVSTGTARYHPEKNHTAADESTTETVTRYLWVAHVTDIARAVLEHASDPSSTRRRS
ncbi:hypothetical protein [Natronobacterium gregoryi]|uniref:hypothetical protein n=1 Tax=Natronobacterium gregoryi TaxID=44930 RepID=UPI0011140C26|nr:hypothetical protein [Natronobacterium gregoryi]